MMKAVTETNFNLPGQTHFYKGKVRDVYTLSNGLLVMVATDRISAFDVVLPKGIPNKGQVLNQIASHFLSATSNIVPNWVIASPDPMVTIGKKCEPFKVEMVIRGYLAGHAWREYAEGKRMLCGVQLPDGLKENDPFPEPIITPSTKAEIGHDEDISEQAIIESGLVDAHTYQQIKRYTQQVYRAGVEMAAKRGLILVDTKYEFGTQAGKILLMDEIHTPDSSRYFIKDGYEERQKRGEPQRQLSKEFVRQWLIQNNFQGKQGQVVPEMSEDWVVEIGNRYIELYEKITGSDFQFHSSENVLERIEKNILNFLNSYSES
jgi:phosphoribosylaminoimidazole-succinocarboxamide synthase